MFRQSQKPWRGIRREGLDYPEYSYECSYSTSDDMQDEAEVKARELAALDSIYRARFRAERGRSPRHRRSHCQRPVVDDARMARALEWVRVMAMQDANGSHLPIEGGLIAAYDPNCGGLEWWTGWWRRCGTRDPAVTCPPSAIAPPEFAAYQQDNGGKRCYPHRPISPDARRGEWRAYARRDSVKFKSPLAWSPNW